MNKYQNIKKYFNTMYNFTIIKNIAEIIIICNTAIKYLKLNEEICLPVIIIFALKYWYESAKIDLQYYKYEQQEKIINLLENKKSNDN